MTDGLCRHILNGFPVIGQSVHWHYYSRIGHICKYGHIDSAAFAAKYSFTNAAGALLPYYYYSRITLFLLLFVFVNAANVQTVP